ncbi:hypothetical protein FRC07_012138 [Ceratobasidium sp. 392]|nr:hypothetical protein FRC07_012138 [Ceratobasidium sp. 392]
MTGSFWDGLADGTLEARTEQARDALGFIISHGGAISRWQTTIITTDGYNTQLVVANFLASIPLPELWYLELDFAPRKFDEEYDAALAEVMLLESSPLFQDFPSKLRTITVKGLPNLFLFGHRNQLHLPGLTHLKLDFVGSSPSLLDVSTMLQVTSQLTVLHLTFAFTADGLPLKVIEADPVFGRGIRSTDRKYLSSKVKFHFADSLRDYQIVDDVPSEDENNSWMTRYRGLV